MDKKSKRTQTAVNKLERGQNILEMVTSLKVNSPYSFYDLSDGEQNTLLEWCRQLEKKEKINKKHTSYGLKHIFEKNNFYITNGAFKGAMVVAGFKVADETELNWRFNISEKSVKDILNKQRKYALH